MAQLSELPEGIFSLLDTDLYKLTMQCAILKYLPAIRVTYAFTNRTSDMRLSRAAYQWIQEQVDKLANIQVSLDELQYLRGTCTYFSDSYLRFLSSFRLQPSKEVQVSWTPLEDTGRPEDLGDLHLDVEGLWLNTILYEIPLLALTSEAYFKFCDKDWSYDEQEQKAYNKGIRLLENGCIFSEFGTRRRRDYHTHDLVMQGLTRASTTAISQGYTGKLTGTSNVHMGMKYAIPPIGTVAHEWFMGIASVTKDYLHANETALRYWVGCFGEGVLGIALTDTFGTPTFLNAFRKSMPTLAEAEINTLSTQIPQTPRPAIEPTNGIIDVKSSTNTPLPADSHNTTNQPKSYAQTFTGVRQDSGNPLGFVKLMREFYDSEGITEPKTIVFSDSLNIDLCLSYKAAAEKAGFTPSFGIGTFFTNDFTHTSPSTTSKSPPLNIVIKLSSANGHPAIKISDNVGKNTGDEGVVREVKEKLGYVEREWGKGDERGRWGGKGGIGV